MASANDVPETFWRCSHVDPNSLFAVFTDTQISMIATHLANGETLCCDENWPAVMTICTTPKQARILADYAHDTLRHFVPPLAGAEAEIYANWNLQTFLESL